MISLLSQRLVFRVPSLGVNAVLRARVVPNTTGSSLTSRAWSRSFVSTPLLAYPVAKAAKAKSATTKATGAATKAAGKVTKKTAVAKKAPAKRVGVVAKRPASKVVKPKAVRFATEDLPPKRPVPSFIRFTSKYREQHGPSAPMTLEQARAVMVKAGEAWRALSEQEKAPYLEEFHTAQDEYRKRLQEYYENASDQLITQINKARSKKGQQRIAPRSQFTGIKRPSVFLPFLADYKKTVTPPTDRTLTPKDMILYIATSAGKAWKALPEAQKAVYQNKYREALKDYLKAKAEHEATRST